MNPVGDAPPLRVLHAYAGNLYGGVEAMLATIARHRLAAPGLEHAFALGFEGRLADDLRGLGLPVEVVGPVRFGRPWTVLAARRRLAALIRRDRPEVLIAHACWPHAVFGPTARRAGVPLVFWQHDRLGSGHWLERLASRTRPAAVVANSRFSAETAPGVFPGVPVEVIHCPVAPPPARSPADREALRRELGTPPDAVAIVQASRLERWKGQSLLLEALGRLADHPGWVAWIAGGAQRTREYEYLEELKSIADRLGLAGRVRFLGQRSDVPRLLAAADIHCQPNTGPEPFGIAFIEALYAGLPAVSTRLGGAAEILDESCGVLTPPGDAGALASALRALIDDPSRRARLGAGGPPRASTLCDPTATLGRLETLLRGLARPSPRPDPMEVAR